MKRSSIAVLMCTCVLPAPALAQSAKADDVIVMRRVVNQPSTDIRRAPPFVWVKTGTSEVPESCGMVSVPDVYSCIGMDGAGAPVDSNLCAGPAPISSTQVQDDRACDEFGGNAFYERRLSSIGLRVASYSGGFYHLSGTYNGSKVLQSGGFILNIADECHDVRTGEVIGEASCSGKPAPSGAGNVSVPAVVNRNTRTVVLDLTAVNEAANGLPGVDDVCDSTASFMIDGADWKVRCDPSAIQDVFYWIPTKASLKTAPKTNPSGQFSTATAGASSVSYLVDGLVCMDSRTDMPASQQSSCQFYPRPENAKEYAVPVKEWNYNRRRAVLDFSVIAAAAPTVDNIEQLCGMSDMPLYVNGQNASSNLWKTICDASLIDDNYRREATTIGLPSVIYPAGTGNGAYNYLYAPSTGGTITLSISGSRCVDSRTSQTADDVSSCAFYPSPEVFGNVSFAVKAASTKSRVAVIDSSKMSSPISSSITNKAAFCSNTSFKTYYNGDGWKLYCDDESLIDDAYYAVSTVIQNPNQTSSCPRYTDGSGNVTCNIGTIPSQGGNWPAVFSGKTCFVEGGNTPANISKCQYINANPVGLFNMKITKRSEKTRTLVIDTAAAREAAPNVSFSSFCSSSVTVNYGNIWQVRCDDHFVDEDFFNRVGSISFLPKTSCPKYSDGSGSASCNYSYLLPAVGTLLPFRMDGNQCHNEAGQIISSTKCQFLNTPAIVPITARIVEKNDTTRVVTFDMSANKAYYNWAVDAVCDKTFTVRFGTIWTARCI